MSHPNAVLKLPRRVGDLIVFARSVTTAMNGNPFFPAPNPPLATVDAHREAVEEAQATLLTRLRGAKEVRNDRLVLLKDDLEAERAYVQQVANADPPQALAIIESAGMYVLPRGRASKGDLVARQGVLSGTARLTARSAGDRASYEWQIGTDGETWALLRVTLQARTTAEGLTPGQRYSFRYRAVTKAGEGAFSQVVSLIVV